MRHFAQLGISARFDFSKPLVVTYNEGNLAFIVIDRYCILNLER